MKKMLLISVICAAGMACTAQSESAVLASGRDSALHEMFHRDSLKIVQQYAAKARWQKLYKAEKFPVINAGKYSGVLPVPGVTEIPDPSLQYKLLFESTEKNPDSLMNKPDQDLVGIARIVNLHVASGIPLKNISLVVVMHGAGLSAICTNAWYRKRFKMDNPSLKLVRELEKIGARFIACGQALDFMGLEKKDLLPAVKVSFTAQTALTSYQLKGYVLKSFPNGDK
jgi:intracellular sulfur oxidation DsrE/DsrF family protein